MGLGDGLGEAAADRQGTVGQGGGHNTPRAHQSPFATVAIWKDGDCEIYAKKGKSFSGTKRLKTAQNFKIWKTGNGAKFGRRKNLSKMRTPSILGDPCRQYKKNFPTVSRQSDKPKISSAKLQNHPHLVCVELWGHIQNVVAKAG